MIILAAMLIAMTGCKQSYDLDTYRVGTNGLTMELSKSNPESVYELENFDNSITISNSGACDVNSSNPARLLISYDTYRLSSEDADGYIALEKIALEGKSKYYPIGEDQPFETEFKSGSLTHLRESSTTNINYNLCYPYTTELTTMTCIDSTKSGDTSAAACKSETYTNSNGQGAPIAITKIESDMLFQNGYVKPQFKVYIENLGGGYVTSRVSCSDADFNDKTFSGKVNVRAWLSDTKNGIELQCGPEEGSEMLRLEDSESYIRCYLPDSATGYKIKESYTTPLIIKVYYTYQVIKNQKIEIIRNDALEINTSQGTCASYQVDDNGKCVNKCEYCSKNPDKDICQINKPYDGFKFTSGFSCSCSLSVCNEKLGSGSCIKGYCPGEVYCCTTNQCDDYQIEHEGKCIDRCAYCSDLSHSSDEDVCGEFDFTGFSCIAMNKTKCEEYASDGACIEGYCGGTNINSYCANMNKVKSSGDASSASSTDEASTNKTSGVTGAIIGISGNIVSDVAYDVVASPASQKKSSGDSSETQETQSTKTFESSGLVKCDYCSQDRTNDPVCKFENKGVVGRASTTFSCVCGSSETSQLRNYQFVPDKAFCDNGMYCCDIMGLEMN